MNWKLFILEAIFITFVLILYSCDFNSEKTQEIPTEERLLWFKQAKFGMFIHWGPYSQLGGEWENKQVPVGENAEWIMQKLQIPRQIYRELAHQFNPVQFNAKEWVGLAKTTGMKYLVITAKHHDGFAMYPSQVSNYNIVDWTPFDRDPLMELKQECEKTGIRFCFYYSHREDWDESFAYGNTWDFNFNPEEELETFEKNYLETKAKPQVRELLKNYGPIGLIWFDRGLYTQKQARDFVEMVRFIQPDCIINGRVGNYNQELMGDYQNLNDNGMPIGGIEEYWETPQTLNETWGYSKFDLNWKSPGTIINRLVEIVSKGGNYLLNIGPKGDGSIPQASVDILHRVGEWIHRNGESIYGTTSSPFPETPWGACTVKGRKLYLHILNWPKDGILKISGLRSQIKSAYFLNQKGKKLSYQQTNHQIKFNLPKSPLDLFDTVLVLEITDQLICDPPRTDQQNDGSIQLDYNKAITFGKTVKRFNRGGNFHISKWTAPEDKISWYINISQTGEFEVKITYAAKKEWAGHPYTIKVGEQRLVATVQTTGDWYEYQTFTIGKIKIDTKGTYEVEIFPSKSLGDYLMYFKEMGLIPR